MPWYLECLLALLVPDDSPAKASIFFLADLFGQQTPTKAVRARLLTLRYLRVLLLEAVGLPTLEPWRTLAGPLQSLHLMKLHVIFLPMSYLMCVCFFRLSWTRGLQGHLV